MQASVHNKEYLLLAVDQLNKYCSSDTVLAPGEYSSFAEANAAAAKHAIASANFDQGEFQFELHRFATLLC